MFNILFCADTTNQNNPIMFYIMLGVMAVAVIGLIVYSSISKKKQAKQIEEQRNSLAVGDKIETVGGIFAVIREIKDTELGKQLLVETGAEGVETTLWIDVKAIYSVIKKKDA